MSARELLHFPTELWAAYRRNDAPRPSIVDVQRGRIDALLAVARRTRRYAGLRSLADAPTLSKGALADDFDGGIVDRVVTEAEVRAFMHSGRPGALLRDRFIVATTSGTTGEVGVFVNDDASFARLRATVFARIFRGQLKGEGFALLAKRRYRLTFVVASGGHTMTSVLALRMPRAGKIAADVQIENVDQSLQALVLALNTKPPHLLHSYATVLELLAHEAQAGRLRIAPEIVTAGSEPVTAETRAKLQAAFPQATIIETWAATEHVALAVGCHLGHLHINEDAAVVEAVDDDDDAIKDGEWSERVLITNLLNHTQPLIRYLLDDRVRIDRAPCPCGSPFARVEVEGRTDDTIYLDGPQGFQAHTPIPFETTLLGTAGMVQYALVHEAQNSLRVSIVVEDDADAAVVAGEVARRLDRYFDEHGLRERLSFVVEQVGSLQRHARSHKLRQITSLVARPATSTPAPAQRRTRREPR